MIATHAHNFALGMITGERIRQEELKNQGRFEYTLQDVDISEGDALAAIIEEVGEVGRNVLARKGLVTDGDTTDEALAKELIQCAALCTAWIEKLYLSDNVH